jgi:hypothetical protein
MGIRGPKGARARADRWHWTLELVKFPDAASFPVARIACHRLDSSRLNIVSTSARLLEIEGRQHLDLAPSAMANSKEG